jgi:deoxycytidine triphosphate deaminase/cell division protein FtsL
MAIEGVFNPEDFPSSDVDAQTRFERYRSVDPLPDVAPALLNTADLLDYVAATGMIYPLKADPFKPSATLKPASCAITVGGPYIYWQEPDPSSEDPEPILVEGNLADGESLTLKQNSIVFVTLAPTFRIPDYIAARFNLKIMHIYRGLLVGTGPLVDPGFVGRLSIPLHNLTANPYTIKGGDRLVWMEFTKISPNKRWDQQNAREAKASYVEFPEEKNQRQTVRDYVLRAYTGPIRSSIPKALGKAERSAVAAASQATAAQKHAEAIRTRFRTFSLIGALTVAIAIAALVYGGYTVVQGAMNTDDSVRDTVHALEEKLTRQQQELVEAQRQVSVLRSQLLHK